ncbi:MAG TPA: glycosyltransferase family 9 protein [Opitutaceae bacterium]|nr:glycosyltransferase family 9 protein [Opitutaceae bacterium]
MAPRILVIRRRYLGDLVLLGAFLRNLRLHWPDAEIQVLADAAYAEVLALNPDVNAVRSPPRSGARWPGFAWQLRRARFTHVFNFDNTEGTAVLARLTGAKFRLGLHHGGYRLKLAGCYTHAVNDPNDLHESRPITEYYLQALPAAGVPIASREVRLVPREADLAWLRRFVGAGGPVLLVHPGSRSAWRVWPLERFARICDLAQDELGAQVVLAGGPGDGEKIAAIRAAAKSHLFAFEQPLSVARFAALARLSAVALCHDSGPMHVAAAVGTPVVALYGSQNAVLFRPAGDGHILVQPSLPCTECVAPERCVRLDSYHNLCVQRNSVETVYAALRRQWERAAAAR